MARRKTSPLNVANFKNGKLIEQNIFVSPKIESLAALTGYEVRKGMESVLTVADTPESPRQIINVVSNDYGFLENEWFYPEIESRLNDAAIEYQRQSINRNNRSFTVDYILSDDNMHVNVKGNNKDIIKPMIRVVNSYDGSNQTTGHFGFFRQICSNGLHVAEMQLKFQIRHRGNMQELVMPKIEELLATFMNNEYYSLNRIFETLAETPISNVEEFVKYTLGQTGLFKYEKSEKNPDDPSVGAQYIIDVINAEAKELGTPANLWLGYNAFNEYIHTQNQRVFMLQEQADRKMFDAILEQVN